MSYTVERPTTGNTRTATASIVFKDATGPHTVYRIADYRVALDVCRLLNNARASAYEAGVRQGETVMLNVGREAVEREHQLHVVTGSDEYQRGLAEGQRIERRRAAMSRHPSSS